MRKTNTIVLFALVKKGNATMQWPIAAFTKIDAAKAHTGLIKLAHSSGNVDMIKALDPKFPVSEDGKLGPLPKFSVVTLPHNPVLGVDSDDDPFAEEAVTI
jgi:hypothetical protein